MTRMQMSETYYDKFSEYYDSIHSDKNYRIECDFILQNVSTKKKLLDVGCGTANHDIILSKHFEKIVGVDLSESMLKIARNKIEVKKIENILFENKSLEEIDEKFDVVISLFNVVNHIENLEELINYFRFISKLTEVGGRFIFDCWNGLACSIEKPHKRTEKNLREISYTIHCVTETETDLFHSLSTMNTQVKIYDDFSLVDEFNYSMKQKLWTPDTIQQILKIVGFDIIKIVPKFNDDVEAKETDYRLTFVCKKK